MAIQFLPLVGDGYTAQIANTGVDPLTGATYTEEERRAIFTMVLLTGGVAFAGKAGPATLGRHDDEAAGVAEGVVRGADDVAAAAGRSPWRLPWSERGTVIEDLLGRNLERTYPVFDRYEVATGIATSIKSLDLRAATYSTARGISNKLMGYALDMADAPKVNLGQNQLRGSPVNQRVLHVALPAVRPTAAQSAGLIEALVEAERAGVRVVYTVVP